MTTAVIPQNRPWPIQENYNQIYNNLPNIEDQNNLVQKISNKFWETLNDEGNKNFNNPESWGLRTLHRHMYVNKNQIMIESKVTRNGEEVLVSRPEEATTNTLEKVYPLSFAKIKGKIVPTEFSCFKPEKGRTECGLSMDAIAKILKTLEENKYEGLLSVGLAKKMYFEGNPNLVETTEKGKDGQMESVVRVQRNQEKVSAIPTFYQFTKETAKERCRPTEVCTPTGNGNHLTMKYHNRS